MKPKGIVTHHSLTKDGLVADWYGIKKYHMSYRYQGNVITEAQFLEMSKKGVKGLEKPWADIGYHAGVERVNGILTAHTGRSAAMAGAHCVGKNDHLGICIIGNFDIAPPDDELLRYAAALHTGYMRIWDLPLTSVHRHHDFHPKSCPGLKFPWEEFKQYISEAL